MDLNINVSRITVAIDATPALIAAIAALTGTNVPVQTKETKEVQEPRQAVASPAEAMAGMSSAMGQAAQAVQTAAPVPQPETQKKDEISDADMRKVIGPAVQKHGQQAIIGILNNFGITTNRVTDVPQEKRAEFLEQVKSLG